MTPRPASAPLRLPRIGAGNITSGQAFDSAMQQIEAADATSAKLGTAPRFPGLILTAADGSSWRVLIDLPSGSLRTELVPR